MDPVEAFDHLVMYVHVFHNQLLLISFNDDEFHSVAQNQQLALDDTLNEVLPELIEALGDRIYMLTSVTIPFGSQKHFRGIGLKINGQSADRILTKGPESGSDAGKAFRTFWGSKAELRRIDGDLYECVVWSNDENICKQIIEFVLRKRFTPSVVWHQITADLLNFALQRPSVKTPLASSVQMIRSMDRLRSLLRGLNNKLPLNVTGVLPISSAFRDTSVFPPSLSVPPSHVVYSKKRAFKTEITTITSPVFPIYVIVTLEQSGRWPSELAAFKHMKRLLVIRIHELLSPLGIPSHVTQDSMLDIYLDGLVFRVSIAQPRELPLLQSSSALPENNKVETEVTADAVDTAVQPVDVSADTGAGVLPPGPRVDTPASLAWRRLNQSMPLIAGLLASVSRDHAHVFPAACRLAKRWLSAHGYPVVVCPYESEEDSLPRAGWACETLSVAPPGDTTLSPFGAANGGRMSEIAVELLVLYASGFCYQSIASEELQRRKATGSVNRSGAQVNSTSFNDHRRLLAGSPLAAFLRFLGLLSDYNWDGKPLLVDLNEGFSDSQKRIDVLDNFKSMRNTLPAMVLATPADLTGAEWTSIGPTRQGLKDIQLLANHSRRLLRAMVIGGAGRKELMTLFCANHQRMDIVLTLKSELLHVRAAESLSASACEPRVESCPDTSLPTEIPPPGGRFWPAGYCYDPVQSIVSLLQSRFGKYCHILWDRHGGNWIGLVWRHVPELRPFSRAFLDGLSVHHEVSPSVDDQQEDRPRMLLTRQLTSVTELLPKWGEEFLHSIRVVADHREIFPKAVRMAKFRYKKRKRRVVEAAR